MNFCTDCGHKLSDSASTETFLHVCKAQKWCGACGEKLAISQHFHEHTSHFCPMSMPSYPYSTMCREACCA